MGKSNVTAWFGHLEGRLGLVVTTSFPILENWTWDCQEVEVDRDGSTGLSIALSFANKSSKVVRFGIPDLKSFSRCAEPY